MASKSANPFAHQDTNLDFFQDTYLPRYYEQDIYQNQRITFRSVSPKIYNDRQNYFDNDMLDELQDDNDALYEQTLLNSDFFAEKKEEENHALHRLRQILGHMNPSYYQPIDQPIPSSVRSQFSSATSSSTTHVMRSICVPDPRDPKGKGKFNPTF